MFSCVLSGVYVDSAEQKGLIPHCQAPTQSSTLPRVLLTGCPDPGLEQKMVYFRMIPFGLVGGSQDTTTLLAEEGTAFIPAGGPGTEQETDHFRPSSVSKTGWLHHGFPSQALIPPSRGGKGPTALPARAGSAVSHIA